MVSLSSYGKIRDGYSHTLRIRTVSWLDCRSVVADTYAPVVNPLLKVESPTDLESLSLIHFDWRKVALDNPTWLVWITQAGLEISEPGQLRYFDEIHAIQAAVAGQGVAILSLALVSD